jgi:uncharacterized protein (TIGR03435 family)
LSWSPEPSTPDLPADSAAGPSLFTALQEQLGLKLERRNNIPLDVLIVDHANKVPTEN